ncbi:hypothetical protein EJ06DRAFT_147436 [Trichodelitschia bisporula]|uniref:Uncharacterized protein n=1 Tax=Trichodelitschia bisporula TaxID=703511 RepID=A0A6G1HN22_9PEZI|nr:hypothetical protein EJ06DRAFT_147436 [Trichodelitschia bisporula]
MRGFDGRGVIALTELKKQSRRYPSTARPAVLALAPSSSKMQHPSTTSRSHCTTQAAYFRRHPMPMPSSDVNPSDPACPTNSIPVLVPRAHRTSIRFWRGLAAPPRC